MTAYLDRIERVNPIFNAIVSLLDPGELLAQADERDRQLARGESMGWMARFSLCGEGSGGHGRDQDNLRFADLQGFHPGP